MYCMLYVLALCHTVKMVVEICHQLWWILLVPNKPPIMVAITHHTGMVVYYHHIWWSFAPNFSGSVPPLAWWYFTTKSFVNILLVRISIPNLLNKITVHKGKFLVQYKQ